MLPCLREVKSFNQLDDGALPPPTGPYQGDHLSWLDYQGKPPEDRIFRAGGIREDNLLELNAA